MLFPWFPRVSIPTVSLPLPTSTLFFLKGDSGFPYLLTGDSGMNNLIFTLIGDSGIYFSIDGDSLIKK